jgi:CRP-like cAMP-binding protein
MALEPVELIAIETRDFALMLRESVDTCFLIMDALSQRLHGLVQEIENLTLHSASSRFACYLLSRLPPYRMAVELDLRKGIIASRLSIKPETLSRIERELSMQGIIAVRGSRIHVLNLKRLEEIAALENRVNPAIPINGKGALP